MINTGTTVMFIIQTTQNRDARAIHLKLDELIRASGARNVFADLEDATDEELEAFQREFAALRKQGASATNAAFEAKKTHVRHAWRRFEVVFCSTRAQARTSAVAILSREALRRGKKPPNRRCQRVEPVPGVVFSATR